MPDESEGHTLPLNPEDKGPPTARQMEETEPQVLHHDENPDIETVPRCDSGSEQRDSSAENRYYTLNIYLC